MDTNTLMMMMMMSGGRSNNNMMQLLLMMTLMGGDSSQLSSALTPQNMMLGMIPGIGVLGKYMIGGVGAVLAGQLMPKRRRYRRRTRVVYRNNYYRPYRYNRR